MWRVRAQDDRGQPVKLYRSGILPIPRAGEHPVAREQWKRVRLNHEALLARDAGSKQAGRRILVLGPVCAVPPAIILALTAPPIGPWVPVLIPLLAVAPLLWKRSRGFLDENPERIMLALLGEGLCAQCGYSLRGIPGGDDWCTVCPECGAAWRFNPPRLQAL